MPKVQRHAIWSIIDDAGNVSLSLTPPPRPQLRGANLTGGGTPYTKWQPNGPVLNTHYRFLTTAEIDLLVSRGMRACRLLFTWEALQPTEYAVIDTLSGNFKIYRDQLFASVAYLRSKGVVVLLDIHGEVESSFAGWKGVLVGQPTPLRQGYVEDLLANLWKQLALRFKDDLGVMIGITNEPHDIPPAIWFRAAQKVIDKVRATGNASKIVMPGVNWTNAGSWMLQNAQAWNLVDPAGNLAVQAHLYFTADGGGRDATIESVDVGERRLRDIVAWCRKMDLPLWVAETGLEAGALNAEATWRRTQAFVDANRDVVEAVLWWAAGPRATWGNYLFNLIDATGQPSNEARLLEATGFFAP